MLNTTFFQNQKPASEGGGWFAASTTSTWCTCYIYYYSHSCIVSVFTFFWYYIYIYHLYTLKHVYTYCFWFWAMTLHLSNFMPKIPLTFPGKPANISNLRLTLQTSYLSTLQRLNCKTRGFLRDWGCCRRRRVAKASTTGSNVELEELSPARRRNPFGVPRSPTPFKGSLASSPGNFTEIGWNLIKYDLSMITWYRSNVKVCW